MKKALIVGINNYPGSARLNGCINDATHVAELLNTNADGTANFDVLLAPDIKTKAELRSLIAKLFKGDEETVLFYFSGHGCITDTGGYIVTPDFRQNDEGISMEEILVMATKSPARNKIIMLDCCHAGAMGATSIFDKDTALLAKGTVILAASQTNQQAMEVSGHGVFTTLLTEALQGGAADIGGEVTTGHIYGYIEKALGSWSQRPVFKANIARSVCLRRAEPVIAPSELRRLKEFFPSVTSKMQLDPSYEYTSNAPHPENIAAFKILRKMHQLGMVNPVDEEYMYYAAVNSSSCKLTSLGVYYWKLMQSGRM